MSQVTPPPLLYCNIEIDSNFYAQYYNMIGPLAKITRTSNSLKTVLIYFGKVWRKSNLCILWFDCLIALYLFTQLPCNTIFLICKTQLCQGRTQWCQQTTAQEHSFGEFMLVQLTFGSCTSPTETLPFTYHPFNGTWICAVENLQRLRFGNSHSPEKFTWKPKIVSLPTSSQEIVKHKSIFTFTFTLHTIYEVNGAARYFKMCWPTTDNDAIIAVLLQHKEEFFWNWRLKIDRNISVPNKW